MSSTRQPKNFISSTTSNPEYEYEYYYEYEYEDEDLNSSKDYSDPPAIPTSTLIPEPEPSSGASLITQIPIVSSPIPGMFYKQFITLQRSTSELQLYYNQKDVFCFWYINW